MSNQLLIRTAFLCAFVWLTTILFTESMPGQETIEVTETDSLENSSDSIVRIRLDPAGAELPVPALKYQLMPPPADLRRGNAAVHYGKAATGGRYFYGDRKIDWDKFEGYLSTPMDELRKLPADKYPRSLSVGDWGPDHAPFLTPLRNAALCRSCDWEIPFRDKDTWRENVEELAATQSYTTIIALIARLQMADGRFDDAIVSLQTGFAMGQHLGPEGIGWLYGHNNNGVMLTQLSTWIQQPNAPNLYWALAWLPVSFSLERATLSGQDHLRLVFPALAEVHLPGKSREFWQLRLESIWDYLHIFDEGWPAPERVLKDEKLEEVVARADKTAPEQLLKRGFDEATIESMSVPQRVLLDAYLVYREAEDEQIKWAGLPSTLRGDGPAKASALSKKAAKDQAFPLVDRLGSASPATSHLHYQQRVALLMTVEAIRAHLASHPGELPETLDAITEVPTPLDPVSDKPFVYKRDGPTKATLTPARINGTWEIDVWEITLTVSNPR